MDDARLNFALGQLLSAAVALSAAAPVIDSLLADGAIEAHHAASLPGYRDALADARAIVTQLVHGIDDAMGNVLDELAAREVRRQRGEMLPGLPAALASLETMHRSMDKAGIGRRRGGT